MGKLALRGLVLAAVIGVLGVGSYAIAGGGSKNFKGKSAERLRGESGHLDGGNRLVRGEALERRHLAPVQLSYSGLEGNVQQSHIHFGKRGGQRRHLVLPVQQPGRSAAGTPACPGTTEGTVEGDIEAADVIGPGATVDHRRRPARASSPATSPRSSRRCGPDTPTRTSTRRSGPAARSARSSTPELQGATTTTTRRGTTLGGEAGLEARDHVQRERRRPRPVDDAMVERDRDVADVADDDLAVDGRRGAGRSGGCRGCRPRGG